MGCHSSIVSFIETRMNPKSVNQVMLPVTMCGWIVGMGVIEIPIGNRWPAASFLYTLVLLVAYSSVAGITIHNMDLIMQRKSSETSKFIFKALFYGNVWLNVCGTILGWLRDKGIKKIVRRLELSDAKMEKMGLPREYGKLYVRQLVGLLLQFVVIFFFMFAALKWNQVSDAPLIYRITAAVAVYYPVILTAIGDVSFVTFVRFMGMRFDQLNKCLKGMLTTTNDSPQHKRVLEYTRLKTFNVEHIFENRTRDDQYAMRAAREYHHELIRIANMINDTFGVQILLSMTVSFALITGLLYNTCNMILWTPATDEMLQEELITACCWLAFYVYRIVIINASCDITSTAAKETGNIICQLHEPSTRKAFRDEIRDFTLQLTQHSLTFTACGFFTLNYGFIQGMIGSITTYLVILIQIGDIPPPEILGNSTAFRNGSEAWNVLADSMT